MSCNQQPIGKSLLSGTKAADVDDTTPAPNEGDLDIQPDKQTMTLNIDDSDRVEITGTCKDLDRKNNRILVEVFAGEEENTLTPYISNVFSDKCQPSATTVGLTDADKCFWVTKGIGLREETGLPTEKTFPQCHNGRFGFSVKLGAVLVNPTPGQPPLKYLIRFKLRTTEGLLAETAFSKLTISRKLLTPQIAVSLSTTDFGCKVTTSNAARFNPKIKYKLERKNTDTVPPLVPPNTPPLVHPYTLFDDKDTFDTFLGDSVFEWLDDNGSKTHLAPVPPPPLLPPALPVYTAPNGIISGMTYSYTLTATDKNFNYAAPPLVGPVVGPAPTEASKTINCEVPRPMVGLSFPVAPGMTSCFMQMFGNPLINPGIDNGLVSVEWGYAINNSGWIGTEANAATAPFSAGCGSLNTCDEPLAPNISYFFAAREINNQDNSKGKWSPVALCRLSP